MARADVIEKHFVRGYLSQMGHTIFLTEEGERALEERALLLRWLAMDLLPPQNVAETLRSIDGIARLDSWERFVLFDKWIEQMWRTARLLDTYQKTWREAFAAGLVPTEEAPPR